MNRADLITRLRKLPSASRIITALDVPGLAQATGLVGRLGSGGRFVKVGLELFSAAGPEMVRELRRLDREVFLDLKYHDIPNTVAAAARVAADLGASLCTIHAGNGRQALTAAAAALAKTPVGDSSPDGRRPALLAVTILTSLTDQEMTESSPGPDDLQDRIARLAELAWDCGCDGLVCAAPDLPRVRQTVGPEALVVTPGIRPAGTGSDDQKRVATPAEAMAQGADFLVIGRPITRADDPAAALAGIAAELD